MATYTIGASGQDYATITAALADGKGTGDTFHMEEVTDEHSITLPANCNITGDGQDTCGIVCTTATQAIFDDMLGTNAVSDVKIRSKANITVFGVSGDASFTDCILGIDSPTAGADVIQSIDAAVTLTLTRVAVSGFYQDCFTGAGGIQMVDSTITGSPSFGTGNLSVFVPTGSVDWTIINTNIKLVQSGGSAIGYQVFRYQSSGICRFYGCNFHIDTSDQNANAHLAALGFGHEAYMSGCTAYLKAGSGTATPFTGSNLIPGVTTGDLTIINSPTCAPLLANVAAGEFDPLNVSRMPTIEEFRSQNFQGLYK